MTMPPEWKKFGRLRIISNCVQALQPLPEAGLRRATRQRLGGAQRTLYAATGSTSVYRLGLDAAP
jgi:hypothetical protein